MKRLDLYCQVSRDRLHSQEELNGEYHTKALHLLSVSVALIAATALILNIPEQNPLTDANVGLWICMGFVIAAFLATAISSILVVKASDNWRYGPDDKDLMEWWQKLDDEKFSEWIGDMLTKSAIHNAKLINDKAIALKAALLSLAAEGLSLIVIGILLVA